jgi:hypothetical protein
MLMKMLYQVDIRSRLAATEKRENYRQTNKKPEEVKEGMGFDLLTYFS